MVGPTSGELLTHQGRVITHTNPRELIFLVPGVRVTRLGQSYPAQTLPVTQHPDFAAVTWPLDPRQFIDPRK